MRPQLYLYCPIKTRKYTKKALCTIGNRQKQKKATEFGDYMAELKEKDEI